MDDIGLTNELILKIFEGIEFRYERRISVPKTFVHKILFKLRTLNPEDKRLHETIPFYWYNHGPFSEPIRDALESLVESETLVQEETKYYSLNTEEFYFTEAGKYEDDVFKLLKKFDVYELDVLVDDVYNYAPLDFIPLYKRKLLEPLHKKTRLINDEEEFHEKINLDQIIELLYDCECELPFDILFKGYSRIFSTFTSIFDNIYEEISFRNFLISLNFIDSMWYTFTKGFRVLDHENVFLYNNQIGYWREKYFEKLDDTNKKFEKLKIFEQKQNRNELIKYSADSKRILSSTVGKYIFD